jgi:hypothetical protein
MREQSDSCEDQNLEHTLPNLTDEQRQAIFDALFEELTNGFGEACEKHDINTAIIIARHPDYNHPIVFARGHQYDVSALVAGVLRGLKAEIANQLRTDE